jgi:hypothetical protein
MLERELSYGPLALVDIAEVVGYYAWSIPVVVLGGGVWGLATGTVVRAVCGTATIFCFSPVGFVMPRINIRLMRPCGASARVCRRLAWRNLPATKESIWQRRGSSVRLDWAYGASPPGSSAFRSCSSKRS